MSPVFQYFSLRYFQGTPLNVFDFLCAQISKWIQSEIEFHTELLLSRHSRRGINAMAETKIIDRSFMVSRKRGDNGWVIGYDNRHDHHRHFKGAVELLIRQASSRLNVVLRRNG